MTYSLLMCSLYNGEFMEDEESKRGEWMLRREWKALGGVEEIDDKEDLEFEKENELYYSLWLEKEERGEKGEFRSKDNKPAAPPLRKSRARRTRSGRQEGAWRNWRS